MINICLMGEEKPEEELMGKSLLRGCPTATMLLSDIVCTNLHFAIPLPIFFSCFTNSFACAILLGIYL